MGDGENDAYAQIRNDVWPATQNYTPLSMISMVSNDIETVNISGLTLTTLPSVRLLITTGQRVFTVALLGLLRFACLEQVTGQ